jgi:protein-disulfide isomerase
VYYRFFCVVPLLLVGLALGAASAPAQVELTPHPSMVKGPPGAPVTIIEFSDYQ